MEFQEVIYQQARMCCYYEDCSDGCPLNGSKYCMVLNAEVNKKEIAKVEKSILEWAKEHPEPIYPTWYEWLCSIGAWNKAGDPIPANIAVKLGIRPKE